jgi:hypothetical protein
LNHLMRTEVSTTIFGAIAAVAVVADDVRRVPVPNPLGFEFAQGSYSRLPGIPGASLTQSDSQGFPYQSTSGSSLRARDAIDFVQEPGWN